MDILKNFGIDPLLLVAQIVNFLIILWLLKKFAYKPIFQMLEKRKKLIEEGVTNAEKTEAVLAKTIEKEKDVLKKAQVQAQEILSDAQKQAQDTLLSAQDSAKLRVEKILEDAKKEIDRQTQDAQRELSHHTAELAVAIIEKALTGLVDSKTQKEIVARATKTLQA